ncbi:uncharacterized protein LOC115886939 [Sitophilus oryzae]|uniref:Uncharacterized protein LOC115876984 n=1 Tax=Sitophilus oryzae TaxID=7048 RepID=A0A6J2XCD6_SITOR|nr:uncharacterized protein LOC115876984 [Sitophilus oryzae]XP_030762130.1 uncharacterized protein LOC115886939 [Sitophilus oryzae]
MRLWYTDKGMKPGDILTKLRKEAKSKIPSNMNLKLPVNLNLKDLRAFLDQIVEALKQPAGSKPGAPEVSRPMKFPYTYSAKLAQFPYKYYFKNQWIFRYYPVGVLAALPLFIFMSKLSKSKGNKEKWKAIRKHEKEEYLHKFDY